jgi:hypothetical protein
MLMFTKLLALCLPLALLLNAGLSLAAEHASAVEIRFGKALRFTPSPPGLWAEAAPRPDYGKPPLTVECWARLSGKGGFNVLAANEPKESADHWELYTYTGSGKLSVYLPGYVPSAITSERDVVDGKWHYLALTFDGEAAVLYVDGSQAATAQVKRRGKAQPVTGALAVGKAAAQWIRAGKGVRPVRRHASAYAVRQARYEALLDVVNGWSSRQIDA